MGVTDEEFYDETKIAQMPMGFCYPGKGKSGDLPPTTGMCPTMAPTNFGQATQPKTDHLDRSIFATALLGRANGKEFDRNGEKP